MTVMKAGQPVLRKTCMQLEILTFLIKKAPRWQWSPSQAVGHTSSQGRAVWLRVRCAQKAIAFPTQNSKMFASQMQQPTKKRYLQTQTAWRHRKWGLISTFKSAPEICGTDESFISWRKHFCELISETEKMHTETSDIKDPILPTRNKYCRAAPTALSYHRNFAMLCTLPFSSSSADEMPGNIKAAFCHGRCKPLHCSPFKTNCKTELEAASSSLGNDVQH